MRKIRMQLAALLLAVMAVTAIGGSAYLTPVYAAEKTTGASTTGENALSEEKKESYRPTLAYFAEVIDTYYLYEVDPDLLVQKTLDSLEKNDSVETAVKKMVDLLEDKYSQYYTPEEFKAVMDSTLGNYVGIGVAVSKDEKTGWLLVNEVFENGPAAKCGVRAGDYIFKVDKKYVKRLTLDEATSRIKGEAGTKVVLRVLRGKKKLSLTAKRAAVTVTTISQRSYGDGIGYIRISQFEDATAKQFAEALKTLRDNGMEKLILDLRGNPGGLVSSAVTIADSFLAKNALVTYTEEKDGTRDEYKASDADTLDIPVVILGNGGTASASELLIGALRYYLSDVTLVGEQTFGKGIVQTFLQFTDGSALKLTTARYYAPDDVCIQGEGFTPDVAVDPEAEDAEDPQLDQAIAILKEK